MFLIFDTETTGFPLWNSPLDDPRQARVCSLACILLDGALKEIASFHTLIKPSGWTISPGAQSAHGISQEQCEQHGLSNKLVIGLFASLMEKSDFVVCHNIKFDTFMLDVEMINVGECCYDWEQHAVCTMLQTTELLKLEKTSNRGPGLYKWPTLTELYKHCTGLVHEKAHSAMGDVEATADCFKWLMQNGHIQLPKVLA